MQGRGRLLRFRRLGRLLVWPLALLALLLLYAHGAPSQSALAPHGDYAPPPQTLPLPSETLRYLLGVGIPSLGLQSPVTSPLGATGVRLAAFLDYTALGVAPHAPDTLFSTAFVGFGFSSRGTPTQGAPLTSWLSQVGSSAVPPAATAKKTNAPQGTILYGKGQPLVAIYATEGLGAYSGKSLAADAPPPISHNLGENALGLAQALAKALGSAGVPTLFSSKVNDGEGELGAYLNSQATAKALLAAAPGASIVLDVERPAYPPTAAVRTLSGKQVATITLVVGTAQQLPDKNWRENLALAKSLGAFLQKAAPGIFAGIEQSPTRLNQQLSPTLLTLDIGGPNATPQQARRAIAYVVQAIASFLGGSPLP